MHKKLISDEAYQRKEYRAALKNAFIHTDDDMRHGELHFFRPGLHYTEAVLSISARNAEGQLWVHSSCCTRHKRWQSIRGACMHFLPSIDSPHRPGRPTRATRGRLSA